MTIILFDDNDFLWAFYTGGSARHSNIRTKDRVPPQQDRRCKLAIVPPLQILNETSPNPLEYLVMLPSTHVHNLARCSIVWNAKTPVTQKSFPRCTIKFRGERRFSSTFSVLLALLAEFYPNRSAKLDVLSGVRTKCSAHLFAFQLFRHSCSRTGFYMFLHALSKKMVARFLGYFKHD